jgi:hypothetical protein
MLNFIVETIITKEHSSGKPSKHLKKDYDRNLDPKSLKWNQFTKMMKGLIDGFVNVHCYRIISKEGTLCWV